MDQCLAHDQFRQSGQGKRMIERHVFTFLIDNLAHSSRSLGYLFCGG